MRAQWRRARARGQGMGEISLESQQTTTVRLSSETTCKMLKTKCIFTDTMRIHIQWKCSARECATSKNKAYFGKHINKSHPNAFSYCWCFAWFRLPSSLSSGTSIRVDCTRWVLNEWNVLLHIDTASVASLEITHTHTHNEFFFIALFICRRVFPIEISLQLPIDISDQSTLLSQYTISNVYTQTRTLDNTSKFFLSVVA